MRKARCFGEFGHICPFWPSPLEQLGLGSSFPSVDSRADRTRAADLAERQPPESMLEGSQAGYGSTSSHLSASGNSREMNSQPSLGTGFRQD